MIEVTFVTNSGDGIPSRIPVADDTTLGKFLGVFLDGDPEDFTVRIRCNGTSVEAHDDYVLQHDDRVSVAPRKVEGE